MADIRVIESECVGCEACVDACPFGVVSMSNGIAVIGEGCNMCSACVDACPAGAIVIERNDEPVQKEEKEASGVWVFAEQRGGRIAGVVHELLGEGRKLAEALGQPLAAVLLGSDLSSRVPELAASGADIVYVADHPSLAMFSDDPYADVFARLIREEKPDIVLFGATSTGRSLAPRIAARLKTGLTADCTGLSIDPESKLLLQTRPAFGGNIMATIRCRYTKPQMATVRPKVMKRAAPDARRVAEVRQVRVDVDALRMRVKIDEFIEEAGEVVNLEDADIIVSGGRGLGDPKHFSLIEELARTLGGAVGASRAAVDAGWIPYSHQVGQTGKTVCPKVYIAVGISGAIQHLAGMQSSDIIVAINKNPDAPIFQVATYGIVGDLFQVVPKITEEFRKAMAE
ncbi:MAG: electron transfer flavoprotein subunit alpha [Bacillota bacterium]